MMAGWATLAISGSDRELRRPKWAWAACAVLASVRACTRGGGLDGVWSKCVCVWSVCPCLPRVCSTVPVCAVWCVLSPPRLEAEEVACGARDVASSFFVPRPFAARVAAGSSRRARPWGSPCRGGRLFFSLRLFSPPPGGCPARPRWPPAGPSPRARARRPLRPPAASGQMRRVKPADP